MNAIANSPKKSRIAKPAATKPAATKPATKPIRNARLVLEVPETLRDSIQKLATAAAYDGGPEDLLAETVIEPEVLLQSVARSLIRHASGANESRALLGAVAKVSMEEALRHSSNEVDRWIARNTLGAVTAPRAVVPAAAEATGQEIVDRPAGAGHYWWRSNSFDAWQVLEVRALREEGGRLYTVQSDDDRYQADNDAANPWRGEWLAVPLSVPADLPAMERGARAKA